MAREHARVLCRIWQDQDWRALSIAEQWLYEALLSQPTISNAGVLPLTPRPWARLAKDTSDAMIESALRGLQNAGFILIDEDTAEVLVRTFIRNDGVSSNGKVFQNALKVARQVQSSKLRRALAAELRKVGTDSAKAAASELDPGTQSIGNSVTPIDRRSEKKSTAIPDGGERRSLPDDFSCGVGEGVGEGGKSPNVGGSVGGPSPAKATPRRGTRIPENFTITPEMRQWANEKTPGLDIDRLTETFVDYWNSKPGKDAVKLDWLATWRNWLRRDHDRIASRPGQPVSMRPLGDREAWLRELWQSTDVRPITAATGLRYEQPDLPLDAGDPAEFFRNDRRRWIEQNRDEILARLKGDAA